MKNDVPDPPSGASRVLPSEEERHDMTLEEFQTIGRGMIVAARARFREEAMALCLTDEERDKARRLEPAIGEVSPEEAVLAFKKWLNENRDPAVVSSLLGRREGFPHKAPEGHSVLAHKYNDPSECPACNTKPLSERLLEEAEYWAIDGLEPRLVGLLREAAAALPHLGQAWVSRVTNSDEPEVSVVGTSSLLGRGTPEEQDQGTRGGTQAVSEHGDLPHRNSGDSSALLNEMMARRSECQERHPFRPLPCLDCDLWTTAIAAMAQRAELVEALKALMGEYWFAEAVAGKPREVADSLRRCLDAIAKAEGR